MTDQSLIVFVVIDDKLEEVFGVTEYDVIWGFENVVLSWWQVYAHN